MESRDVMQARSYADHASPFEPEDQQKERKMAANWHHMSEKNIWKML